MTRVRARSENWTPVQFGFDLKLVRIKNKRLDFEECGLEKEREMMRGERDIYIYIYIHEAFQRRRVAASNKTG